jgi:hypothetical protein
LYRKVTGSTIVVAMPSGGAFIIPPLHNRIVVVEISYVFNFTAFHYIRSPAFSAVFVSRAITRILKTPVKRRER